MTLGSDWLKKINPQSQEPEIKSILQKNEVKAEQYFEWVHAKEAQEAVSFCVDHEKPYIVLNAPLCILDSDALSSFKAWARDQHLEARILGINTERFHAKQDDCIALALMPN